MEETKSSFEMAKAKIDGREISYPYLLDAKYSPLDEKFNLTQKPPLKTLCACGMSMLLVVHFMFPTVCGQGLLESGEQYTDVCITYPLSLVRLACLCLRPRD